LPRVKTTPMLRISYEPERAAGGGVLKLDGQVSGEWVEELRRAYDDRRPAVSAITIDLKDVTFIDRAGIAFFDEIYADVTLINCSLFAAEQLKPVIARHDAAV